MSACLGAQNEPYRLEFGDRISIRCLLDPHLCGNNVLVRPDGIITVTGIGEVTAAGLTPETLANKITQKYLEAKIFSPDILSELKNLKFLTVRVDSVHKAPSVLSMVWKSQHVIDMAPVPVGSYRLKPGDIVSIKCYADPGLSERNVLVQPDGMITVPGIGSVPAGGKRPDAVARMIESLWVKANVFPPSITREYLRMYRLASVSVDRVYVRSMTYEERIFFILGTVSSTYIKYRAKPWLWAAASIVSCLGIYVVAVTALLFLAWRRGSAIFSRTWLISLCSKPLLITPGLGRWAIFLGYERRLRKLKDLEKAQANYFGLPADDDTRSPVSHDMTGEKLHHRITEVLFPQQPVIIIGDGGAGKSTLLARLAWLSTKGLLPGTLRQFRPVLVTAGYYGGDLVQSVADTLRERDKLAIDRNILNAQLQSGKYLILFDGVSEVSTDTAQALREMIRTARHADYDRCRFIFATRPMEGIPSNVSSFKLQPLTRDVLYNLLPRYGLGREREKRIRVQLESLGDKPIEPLLFVMIMAQCYDDKLSSTKAELYERYFRCLLRAEGDDVVWTGWRVALEALADWFLLRTGRRGVGLPHDRLMRLIGERVNGDRSGTVEKSLIEKLRDYYHIKVADELDLLRKVESAGLLQPGRRWRFAHDTFEEYFAASFLVAQFDATDQAEWPLLRKWHDRGDEDYMSGNEEGFLGVVDFMREMADKNTKNNVLRFDIPDSWRRSLCKGAD